MSQMMFQVLRFGKPFSVTTSMKLLRKTSFFFWQTNITGGNAFNCNNDFMKTRALTCTYVRNGNAEATVRIVAAL
jgi:hypothetical protein